MAARAVSLLAVLALCAASAAAAAATMHSGCVRHWCATGRVPADQQVPVLLAIKHQNLDELDAFFWEVSNPKSPKYGKYLSLAQLNEMIGNPEATEAVVSFLKAAGVPRSAMDVTKNGEFVSFYAPASLVERLFEAEYHQFKNTKTGAQVRRSVSHAVPVAIRHHVDFVGHVSNFPSPFVGQGIRTARNNTALAAAADALVTPAVVVQTYNINPNTATSGQSSMSVFETLGQAYRPADLATFEQTYNLAAQKVAKVIGPNKYGSCASNPDNCGEANLDVQYIIAVAQGVPLTFWSISASDQTPYYDWIVAVSNDASPPLVHSVSYGDIEAEDDVSVMNRTGIEFQKMGARGLTIVIASGDDGVANFEARADPTKCGFNPSWPASSSYVTAVGATQFQNGNANGGEIPCQTNNNPASLVTSGGGFSLNERTPSYQLEAVAAYLGNASLPSVPHTAGAYPSKGFNAAGRGYPDVAALGHNYQVVIEGQVISVDGTSASAPVVAGMFALINDQRLANGQPSLGFVNPTLYNLAGTNVFTDITSGNNRCTGAPQPGSPQTCCTNGFNAIPGWDPVTGLGTINFTNLAAQLVTGSSSANDDA